MDEHFYSQSNIHRMVLLKNHMKMLKNRLKNYHEISDGLINFYKNMCQILPEKL